MAEPIRIQVSDEWTVQEVARVICEAADKNECVVSAFYRGVGFSIAPRTTVEEAVELFNQTNAINDDSLTMRQLAAAAEQQLLFLLAEQFAEGYERGYKRGYNVSKEEHAW